MEELKPVAGNTLGGVKALFHQGSEVEAGEESEYPDLVDGDTSSEEDSDSGGEEEELIDSAGSIQRVSLAETEVEKIEWESMWDEVISGISDGRRLSPEAARRLAQLKEEAVEHAAMWQSQLGKQ